MKILKLYIILALCINVFNVSAQSKKLNYDVVIYGATSAGIIAAVSAQKAGASVVLIGPEKHIGGLTTSGLGSTDIGKQSTYKTIGGLTLDFFKRIRTYYQKPEVWKSETFTNYKSKVAGGTYDISDSLMWTFEPHVAEKVFNDIIRENNIPLKTNQWLDRKNGIKIANGNITSITTLDGNIYDGKIFIDATYEGDLLAAAGVSYTTGREPNSLYGETINGIQRVLSRQNNLPRGINPYKISGDLNSGLLPGINENTGGEDGEGDKKIQAYCYRVCLTDDPENRIMVTKPLNYKKEDFELVVRSALKGTDVFWKLTPMPNRKTDSNNDAGVSMDFIGMNYNYPEASYAERKEIDKAHIYWTKGLIWTVQNDPRIPIEVRKKYGSWGLPKNEFQDNGHLPYQLYVREARRMVSDFVMSESYLKGEKSVPQPIGMGNYTMDSHNVQRYVTKEGDVQNEGDVQIAVEKPYSISYKAIVPKNGECKNILVPVCLSSSHIAYGSIRMEPVFMMLAQSAGIAAALAIESKTSVQDIDYQELNHRLLRAGQILTLKSSD